MGTAVVLFTRDLRVHDNPVLHAGCAAGRVVPLFVVDEHIAATGFRVANRAAFLAACLADLDSSLARRGARLVVRRGEVVDQVRRVAAEVGSDEVHLAEDVSGYAARRRARLRQVLDADGRRLVAHDAVVTAVAPGELVPTGGGSDKDHFAVFTPYYRQWARRALRRPLQPPRLVRMPGIDAGEVPTAGELGACSVAPELLPGGETQARRRLADWCRRVGRYDEHQDRLSEDGTSRLSPYLHFGCVSAAEVVHRASTGAAADSQGAASFVRQLAWRDFHHQVLAARPEASQLDYRTRGDRWRRDERAFDAWRAGQTGYPVVDAGMRQLLAQGWMHNRARLIVGSFLTKTLYLDWRLGAAHFLAHLVDGDVANNQLNWQWVAGTGTDTRPNRVLNPIRQARRYDPDGDYVRRWVPELADVEGAAVHEPWLLPADRRRRLRYPEPITDLREAAERFHAAREK